MASNAAKLLQLDSLGLDWSERGSSLFRCTADYQNEVTSMVIFPPSVSPEII
jgi:hypothetical protein